MPTAFKKDALGFYIDKDPNANLDYEIDWTRWLDGDAITGSVWTVPAGLNKTSESQTTSKAKVWLSGGTLAATYTVTNRITTASGRVDDQSFRVMMAER